MLQKLLSSYAVFIPNQLKYYSFHTRISLTHHKLSSHTYSRAQIDSRVNKREQSYKCDDCITHLKKNLLSLSLSLSAKSPATLSFLLAINFSYNVNKMNATE
jgi:hypothetical protein